MYTLRKVGKSNTETNYFLGNEYSVILRETDNGKVFNSFMEMYFGKKEVGEKLTEEQVKEGEEIYGFVSQTEMAITPDSFVPLSKEFKYYVMTERGNTFCNLSFK